MNPRGVLVIDKPCGPTSTDIVRKVRKIFSTRRVGHAGTLDPDASGVLIVCVGEATKAVPYLVDETKVYETEVCLGAETETDDAAGAIRDECTYKHITEDLVQDCLPHFLSQTEQIPPRVSALKVDGKRMHARVRDGEDVERLLKPRQVTCYNIDLLHFDPPILRFRLTVGKGYYIRSFARDLGRALQTAAHVKTLRRLAIGTFSVSEAISLSDDGMAPELMPLETALDFLPRVRTDERAAARLRHGQRIRMGDGIAYETAVENPKVVLALEPTGEALAVATIEDETLLRVLRVFAPPEAT